MTFDDIFAKFVISPYSKFMLTWNLLTTVVYLFSIFVDTLVIGFHLKPLLNPHIQFWSSIFSIVMVIDVGLKFCVAFRAN